MHGLITALITPLTRDKQLDEEGLNLLLKRQIEAEVDGILVLGTTGEAPTLSSKEKERVIHLAAESTKGVTKLIVGTGGYCTRSTIEETKRAQDLGADSALVVVPYYNKPTQAGILEHFLALIEASDLPLILYNHPGRCGAQLELGTLKKLAQHPQIVGIKECSGSMQLATELLCEVPNLELLSGDDGLILAHRSVGAQGLISVLANLLPLEMKRLLEKGEGIEELWPFIKATAIESNPIPIKTMMRLSSLPSGPCRLPLTAPEPQNEHFLKRLMEKRSLPHGAA